MRADIAASATLLWTPLLALLPMSKRRTKKAKTKAAAA
jgi:hypothetical protein